MTNAPERIFGWQNNQLSLARYYGGLKYQGHQYYIAPHEDGEPLVRSDVIKREAKEKKEQAKSIRKIEILKQGSLL